MATACRYVTLKADRLVDATDWEWTVTNNGKPLSQLLLPYCY